MRGEVAFSNKYTPSEVEELEFQDQNYKGLFWWYNKILTDVAQQNKQNTK